MSEPPPRIELGSVDLRTLVGHAVAVAAATTVDQARAEFVRTNTNFLAVVDGASLLGACSRQELAQELGSRFGYALNAHRPIAEHLMSAALRIVEGTPVAEVFQAVATRSDKDFYDDILLVDRRGAYLGMLQVRTLVRLQTEFLVGTIVRLEASQREIATRARQLEDDLLMASKVQLALMPRDEPPPADGRTALRIAHRFQPAGGVSGDFFDIVRIPDQSVGILICDVMGHGVRSALITAMVRALLEQLRPLASDPGAFLGQLNRILTRILRQTGDMIFVTAAYCVFCPDSRRLRYAQAGHPTPLLLRRSTGAVQPLACTSETEGPALGLVDDFDFASSEESFEAGDRAILFTDGVVEANSPDGEEFGTPRLTVAWAHRGPEGLEDAVSGLLADLKSYCGGSDFADDVCIIAAELA